MTRWPSRLGQLAVGPISPAILLRSGIGPAGERTAVACLTPASRGSVRLTGPGPGDRLLIDHRYLSDPGGHDRARLAEGIERGREIAEAPELRRLLGRETRPGPGVSGRRARR